MSRSQHQLKVRPLDAWETRASDQAHYGSDLPQRHIHRSVRTASARHDLLITALLVAAVSSILVYFLGWFIAVAVIATVIVALSLCLNFLLNHTIEF